MNLKKIKEELLKNEEIVFNTELNTLEIYSNSIGEFEYNIYELIEDFDSIDDEEKEEFFIDSGTFEGEDLNDFLEELKNEADNNISGF